MKRNKHCSDELLLSFLSGELLGLNRTRVRRHLESCWKCRVRSTELDGSIHELTDLLTKHEFLPPERFASSRRLFFEKFARQEDELGAVPSLSAEAPMASGVRWRWPVAAAALLCLAALGLRQTGRNDVPETGALVEVMVQTEEQVYQEQKMVHQKFSVELRELRPQPSTRKGQLEVWYDPPQERFTANWSGLRGDLRYALWKPGPSQRLVYDASARQGKAKVFEAAESRVSWAELQFETATLEELERNFLGWVAGREWKPVRLAREIAFFRSRDGVVCDVRRRDGDSSALILTARRSLEWGRVELTAEIDAETYETQLQRLRVHTPERSVELVLAARRVEFFSAARVAEAVFHPPRALLARADVTDAGTPALLRSMRQPRSESRDSLQTTAALEADRTEVRVRYILHILGSCRGEAVHVARSASGRIRVEGIVETADRKYELKDALDGLGELVTVEIHTVPEALTDVPQDPVSVGETAPPSSRAGGRRLSILGGDPPASELVRRYLQSAAASRKESRDQIGPEIASFLNKVVARSRSILNEAWALRRLAEIYRNKASLSSKMRETLTGMIEDHISAVGEDSKALRRQLAPLIAAGSVGSPIHDFTESRNSIRGMEELIEVFELTRKVDTQVSHLFAGADFGKENTTPWDVNSNNADVAQQTADLLRLLAKLESPSGFEFDAGTPPGDPSGYSDDQRPGREAEE